MSKYRPYEASYPRPNATTRTSPFLEYTLVRRSLSLSLSRGTVHTLQEAMQLTSLFKKPPGYVTASILCSFGGFLFGHDTGIIGPVTVMDDFTKYVGNPSPTIHGLIVSSILIPAAVSSFFAGRLADVMGRTRGIALGSFIFALGAAIEAASVHIAMFVVGRVVEGIGEGLYLGTLVVYVYPRGFEIHQTTSNAAQVHL
jgi:hypothetical protein